MELRANQLFAVVLSTLAAASARVTTLSRSPLNAECRNLPGDSSWPDTNEWAQLNETVGGRLIATVPLAASCHGAAFDAEQCAHVQSNWTWPWGHFRDPASIQNPYWLNNSCSPFTDKDAECVNGNIAEYSINITGAADAAAGLKFAQEKNIRLVIKNTGHDFLGRSTGKGSLNLWTHHLNDVEFLDYQSESYTGRAVKMGAGVQAFEAYTAAAANGLTVMGGFCPTVGLAGGYTQGAGHGPLNGEYGLAADNALEWEVVTAQGEHLFASKENNTDLYWALSGGGGGTYGVVLSLTSKAHPDGLTGGGTLQFMSAGISDDTYWDAVEFFNAQLPSLAAQQGLEMVYSLTNASFFLNFLTWVNHTAEEVTEVMSPVTDYLTAHGISFTPNFTDSKGFHDHYARYTPDLPFGDYQISEIIGGRMVPYDLVENNNALLTAALRNITLDPNWILNGVVANTTHARSGTQPRDNAVLPAWRNNLVFYNIVRVWDPRSPLADLDHFESQMTNEIVPQLENITPGSGTYINEGDFNNPNWKEDYFGANFDRLLSIKNKYDPNHIFYGPASVGSEDWVVAGDGRLCRAPQS